MNFVKIFISSGVAFFMAILVALLIETFGGAIGSIIGTLPSTIIPAAYILLTEESKSVEERTESMIACLFGMLATDILFMPCWKVIPPKLPKKWSNGWKVFVTSLISLIVWFIGAVVMILLKVGAAKVGINIWVFGLLIMLVCGSCGVYLCWTLPPTPAGKNKVKLHVHMLRGLAAAIAIFVSGVLSQTDMGVIAGAMVTFPAIFLTTMVSVSLAQGADVSTGAIGPMLFGGMCVGWYSLSCAFLFSIVHMNAFWCCFLSFFVAGIFWSIPVYFFVRWRRDLTALKTQQLIAEAVSEKEAVEMKEMKPTENNPNDTALPHPNSIIPPAVNSPEVEKSGEGTLQEEKVDIPSQEIATGIASEVVSPQIASEVVSPQIATKIASPQTTSEDVSPEEGTVPVESETNK